MNGQSEPAGPPETARILYFHGWGSRFDPGKGKILSLGRIGPVHGLTVDYTLHPHAVFATYAELLTRYPRALVVGTSLGGFYAAWLGAEFNRRFLAINPATAPGKTLQAHVGTGVNHAGEPFDLTQACVSAYDALCFRLDGPGTVVLDRGDEVLDARATLELVRGRLPVVAFDGGSHRFDHMDDLIESRPDLFQPC